MASRTIVLVITLAAASVDATHARAILTRMREAVGPQNAMSARFELDVSHADGERARWTGVYYRRGGGDPRLRMVIDSPADLRGAEIAVAPRPDGTTRTRLYLPALRRVRDIEGDMRGESFLGTDFNYEDIGLQPHDGAHDALHGENRIEGRACYRVASKPGRKWWYGKVLRFIDEQNHLPLRTEYYDRSGTLWKVRTLAHVRTIDGIPTATELTMRTLPAGTATRITLRDVRYRPGLAADVSRTP